MNLVNRHVNLQDYLKQQVVYNVSKEEEIKNFSSSIGITKHETLC